MYLDSAGALYVQGRTHDFRNTIRHLRSAQGSSFLLKPWQWMSQHVWKDDLQPAQVPAPEDASGAHFLQVFAGPGAASGALDASGNLWMLGSNTHGQLGCGTVTDNEYSLQQVDLPEAAVDACIGFQWAAAIGESGALYTWGKGGRGQLAQGDNNTYKSPISVAGALEEVPMHAVAAGFSHGAAIGADGSAWTWGRLRALEPAPHRPARFRWDAWRPVLCPMSTAATAVACSQASTAMLDEEGHLWMLGLRGRGLHWDATSPPDGWAPRDWPQAGLPDVDNVVAPLRVPTDQPWFDLEREAVQLVGGVHHMYIVDSEGEVWRFGWRGWLERVQPLSSVSVQKLAPGFLHWLAVGTPAAGAAAAGSSSLDGWCPT